MKNEAVARIKRMLTPEVKIVTYIDHEGKIVGQIDHEYGYPEREGGPPIPWVKRFNFEADQEGNVISTQGLF